MKIGKISGLMFLVLLSGIFWASVAWADKSSVKLEAPAKAAKGEEISIKLQVTHNSNFFLHYTNWVVLKINGQEVQKWEYSAFDKPPAAEFTKEFKYKAEQDLVIEAEANCNLHGSKGMARAEVQIE